MKKTLLVLLTAGLLASSTTADAQSLDYSLAVTDFAAPSSFSVTFFKPIAPLTGLTSYSFSGFITLSDASGDGVSASPASFSEFWLLEVGNGSGVSAVDVVGGTSTLTGPGTFDFVASGMFDCSAVGSCNSLSIKLSFLLSGEGDQALSEGEFTLQSTTAAVPEPGALALIGLALAGFTCVGACRTRPAA